MKKTEYWQTDFETKLSFADAWISKLTYQYIESKIKQKKPQDALNFIDHAQRTQSVFNAFKSILMRAEIENNELLKENRELKRKVSEYESDNLAIDMQSLSELKSQMERDMRKEMQEFKDKYQLQIEQLEKDKDKLIQQLINKK
jgi:hypothetical protein